MTRSHADVVSWSQSAPFSSRRGELPKQLVADSKRRYLVILSVLLRLVPIAQYIPWLAMTRLEVLSDQSHPDTTSRANGLPVAPQFDC